MRSIHYTDQPLYTDLNMIKLFENVSVTAFSAATTVNVLINGKQYTREYHRDSFVIFRGSKSYIYGNFVPKDYNPDLSEHPYLEFTSDIKLIRPLFYVASGIRSKQVFVRQKGEHRGKAFYQKTFEPQGHKEINYA